MAMKDYVSKLNDRNLQRKRESGVTSYALSSVVLLALYELASRYPAIPFRSHFPETIEIFAYGANMLAFGVLLFTFGEISFRKATPVRLIWRSTPRTSFFEIFLITSFFGLTFLVNVYCLIRRRPDYDEFFSYNIIAAILFGLLLVFSIWFGREERRSIERYDLFLSTGKQSNETVATVVSLISIGFLVSSLLLLYSSNLGIAKLPVLIFGIIAWSLPILLAHILEIKEGDAFTKTLEDLEYEIHLRDLSEDEIRDRLQRSYLGFHLAEWIKVKETELKSFIEEIDGIVLEVEEKERDLSNVDKEKYPIEFKGRYDKIQRLRGAAVERISSYFESVSAEIVSIGVTGKLAEEERVSLSTLELKVADLSQKSRARFILQTEE